MKVSKKIYGIVPVPTGYQPSNSFKQPLRFLSYMEGSLQDPPPGSAERAVSLLTRHGALLSSS